MDKLIYRNGRLHVHAAVTVTYYSLFAATVRPRGFKPTVNIPRCCKSNTPCVNCRYGNLIPNVISSDVPGELTVFGSLDHFLTFPRPHLQLTVKNPIV